MKHIPRYIVILLLRLPVLIVLKAFVWIGDVAMSIGIAFARNMPTLTDAEAKRVEQFFG